MTRQEKTQEQLASAHDLTAEALLKAVMDEGVVTSQMLASLLGESRHKLTLNKLELALARENIISSRDILIIKSRLSGMERYDGVPTANTLLPSEIARHTGALVVSESPLTIVVVDPKPEYIEQVLAAVGRDTARVLLTTASIFTESFKVAYTGASVDNRQEITDIYTVFDEAIRSKASDIHLAVGQPVVLRVDGNLVKLNYRNLDKIFMERLITEIGGAARLQDAERHFQSDFAYPFGVVRFRCNAGMNSSGLTLAARALPSKVPTEDELGLPESVRRFTHLERGLVLVTGQTGSGKSTTLAALLAAIAIRDKRHIITLEDPIEFVLPDNGNGHIDQRQLGGSFSSFPQGLRQALRQDPDVILVGELRDWETMSTALAAAETGHLVFATLHTSSAEQTISRLVSAAPAEEQEQVRAALAYILKGVVSQVLLPSIKGKGRVAAFEVMVSNAAVANNMRKMDSSSALRQIMEAGSQDGMQLMDSALAALVNKGLVSESEAAFRARNLSEFSRRLTGGR